MYSSGVVQCGLSTSEVRRKSKKKRKKRKKIEGERQRLFQFSSSLRMLAYLTGGDASKPTRSYAGIHGVTAEPISECYASGHPFCDSSTAVNAQLTGKPLWSVQRYHHVLE